MVEVQCFLYELDRGSCGFMMVFGKAGFSSGLLVLKPRNSKSSTIRVPVAYCLFKCLGS